MWKMKSAEADEITYGDELQASLDEVLGYARAESVSYNFIWTAQSKA